MFVRKKRNQSGSTSVQIIDKSGNKYRVVNTVGSSNNPVEIGRLLKRAYAKLDSIEHEKQLRLFPSTSLCEDIVNDFLDIIGNENIRTIGPELIFGTVFDRIGFNAIPEDMFRHLVITRLVYPASKLKTVDYIYRHQGQIISEDAVYKFLDRFKAKHKDEAERIAFAYTQKTIKNISVVFYDMTTLYFEAEKEDELRKIGFSKDGKFQKPQIMLGLLVAEHGYPIGYDIFEGNTFEGHTLLPVLEGMQKRFNLARPVVVADAALLSDKNIRTLSEKQYQFIIGARIKNESKEVKKVILKKSLCMKNGDSFSIEKNDGQRLIVTYSDNRAKKDAYNRERGVKRLQQRIKAGRLTKESINNRGYNKFLILHGQVQVAIDKQKVQNDQQWDGLKGYITNTRLRNKTVVENYRHLWKIEKAFRISKHDLKIRPVYHYKRNRIEAHICIAFAAYTVWKELERLLSANKTQMTPARAADLACNMYAIEYQLAESGEIKQKILNMTPEQQSLWQAVRK
jgi:transposase